MKKNDEKEVFMMRKSRKNVIFLLLFKIFVNHS